MGALDGTITMTTAEYRPCYVDGIKALFHRWAEKETPLFKIQNEVGITQNEFEKKLKYLMNIGVTPTKCDVHMRKQTVAIVEYDSGSVAEVEPHRIVFADDKIKEYAFNEDVKE